MKVLASRPQEKRRLIRRILIAAALLVVLLAALLMTGLLFHSRSELLKTRRATHELEDAADGVSLPLGDTFLTV